MQKPRLPRDHYNFGIGEWYGRLFHRLSPEDRLVFANAQAVRGGGRSILCPYFPAEAKKKCSKGNGVCSMRRYVMSGETGEVEVLRDATGSLRIVCPNRFREDGYIYRLVSKEILGTDAPEIVNEVGFLTSVLPQDTETEGDDVGRIDQILFVPNSNPLEWCALEVQAVYISGSTITNDFTAIRNHQGDGFPFPTGNHRPDYRSSGPKRLMPQLQIKVPTLRRWGKKMAVVVDKDFFAALAPMDTVRDISNCDIVWFVVEINEPEMGDKAYLTRTSVVYTTLERAVEGLTAGIPVGKPEFERRIMAKYTIQQITRRSTKG